MAFGRNQAFDRSRTLEIADTARAKGRHVKAIAEYQKILTHHPDDAAVHGKLAPLLAAAKRKDEALKSFVAAAGNHSDKGFADRAIAVYVQAVGYFPKEVALWEKIVALHLARGRKADALKTLLDARRKLDGKTERPAAITLLKRALEMDASHVGATVDLARLLKKEGNGPEAIDLLRSLMRKAKGDDQRHLRHAEFSVAPSPATLWRWWFGG